MIKVNGRLSTRPSPQFILPYPKKLFFNYFNSNLIKCFSARYFHMSPKQLPPTFLTHQPFSSNDRYWININIWICIYKNMYLYIFLHFFFIFLHTYRLIHPSQISTLFSRRQPFPQLICNPLVIMGINFSFNSSPALHSILLIILSSHVCKRDSLNC